MTTDSVSSSVVEPHLLENRWWRFWNWSRSRQVISLLVLSGLGAGAFFLISSLGSDGQISADGQIEIPVRRGDVESSVSLSGKTSFPERESLSFPAGGTVAALAVDDGDRVEAGQVIAELDEATRTRLELELAEARSAVTEAQEVVEGLNGTTSALESARAESRLVEAELAVEEAQQAKNAIDSPDGSEGEELTSARTSLLDANAALDAAEEDLGLATESRDQAVGEAQKIVDKAEKAYADSIVGWFGSTVPTEFRSMDPDQILDLWGVTYAEIFDTESEFEDDASTPWNELQIFIWVHLSLTPIDVSKDPATRPGLRSPQLELEDAWEESQDAKKLLATVLRTEERSVQSAELAVEAAKITSGDAEQRLLSVSNPRLRSIRAALLNEAAALRDEARRDLQSLEASGIGKIEVAQALLELAVQQLETAQAAVDQSQMTAPFDGVVKNIRVSEGDIVTSKQVVLEIVDDSAIAVQADIDEEDVLAINIGDEVAVTLEALRGQVLNGFVESIGDAEESQQGNVTAPVTIRLDRVEGQELIEGLTASATVVGDEVKDVLRVPSAAVGGSFFQPTVQRITSTGSETVPIETGVTDGRWVELKSGVNEGDMLAVRVQSQSGQSPLGFPGLGSNGSVTLGSGDVFVLPGGGGN